MAKKSKQIQIVYDKRRSINYTKVIRYTDGSAKIVIGTRGATKQQITNTLRHEKRHLTEPYKIGTKIWQTPYKRAVAELKAYKREKESLSARAWNRILAERREDFKTYFEKLIPDQRAYLRPIALRILRRRTI